MIAKIQPNLISPFLIVTPQIRTGLIYFQKLIRSFNQGNKYL